MSLISFLITGKFWNPVFAARVRDTPLCTCLVLMPEAAVNKDRLLTASKNEIGLAWQIS
jgi:hypothetical protein